MGRKQPQRITSFAAIKRKEKALKITPANKNLKFGELKKRGIYLSYHGDKDKDGVANVKDCRPLNKKRQDDMEVTEIDEFEQQIEEQESGLGKKIMRGARKSYGYVSELARKHREDREKFDEELQNLSDIHLKELALRHRDTSLFGGGNPYEDELVRRIQKKKELEQKIADAKKGETSTGLFG